MRGGSEEWVGGGCILWCFGMGLTFFNKLVGWIHDERDMDR